MTLFLVVQNNEPTPIVLQPCELGSIDFDHCVPLRRLDYLHEVEHGAARIARLDSAITEAAKSAPPQMRAVIEALRALRGTAHVSQ
jgi:hypothetical protein